MRRFRFLGWIIVPVGLIATYGLAGLPHLRWSYSWLDEGHGHSVIAPRYYTACTYRGPFGRFTFHHPEDGNCALIVFRKRNHITQG